MARSMLASISLPEDQSIDDIRFPNGGPSGLPEKATFNFLAIVNVDVVPLHLVIGRPQPVTTTSAETERWFATTLLHDRQAISTRHRPWWEGVRSSSPLGVLVAVPTGDFRQGVSGVTVTEILLYASRNGVLGSGIATPSQSSLHHLDEQQTPDPKLGVYALLLSSDLLCPRIVPSPPASPPGHTLDDAKIQGTFLPPTIEFNAEEIVNEPPVRKRKDLNSTFDEANERRKRARRHGGESVAAAAASNPSGTLPSLKEHRRSTSAASGQAVPLQTRPISRSPSVTSPRPATARAASTAPHRSSLSHMQTASSASEDAITFEKRNKDLISHTVMAGMRLYGMSQSKKRKSRPGTSSGAASPTIDVSFLADNHDEAMRRDEEYKLVYHQVFKGACFAFRQHVSSTALQAHVEALRDTIDKLLALFCTDPLEAGLPGISEEFTPGGRKAFGVDVSSSVGRTGLMPAG